MSTEPEESIWDNYKSPSADDIQLAEKIDYIERTYIENPVSGGLFEQMQQANVYDFKQMKPESFKILVDNLSKKV